MGFKSEQEFETYIRNLINNYVTNIDPAVYALKNKKAVDILICRDSPRPELFFIEVKFDQRAHGRLGFGGKQGGGFQPEIVTRQPAYFERNLRWAIASEDYEPDKVLFVSSETIRHYVAGGVIGDKYNNIQRQIFRQGTWLGEGQFIAQLQEWLGVSSPRSAEASHWS